MNQKKLITILATITIIAIMSVSLFFTQLSVATATTYNPDNLTVTGVLATDTYVLYPYAKENLIFGISKYGEMINGAAQQGLEYDGMDVFANPNVLEEDWSQGWFIDIHYAGKDNSYKRVWAFAMYTDLSGSTGIGGDWQEGCTLGPLGAPHGGRKTNAWATTDDIKILYDGPRRFVALTNTTIYEDSAKTKALVGITITFVFNKVKKCVTLFKDIKRLDKGKWGRTFQVEFSNRGQWDIGTTSSPPSYGHFYDDQPTVYDYEYHDFYNATNDITGFDVAQMIDEGGSYVGFAAFWPQLFGKIVDGTGHITPDDVLSSLCTKEYNRTWLLLGSPSDGNITFSDHDWPSATDYPRGAGLWSDEPMVYKNGILQSGGGVDYTWTGDATDKIEFTTEPLDTDYIIVVYKNGTNVDADDMSNYTTEPDTPYVIGEWCFDLEDMDYKRQFRAVTVYGLTDRHDGDDDDSTETWSTAENVIDCEVQYYLNETFNPYDLYSAVHKDTRRWVDFHNVTATEITAKKVSFNLTNTPVIKPDDWLAYCNWAEKVEWDGALRIPYRANSTFGDYDYTYYRDSSDGTGNITITWTTTAPFTAGTDIKVLYSTNATWHEVEEDISIGNVSVTGTSPVTLIPNPVVNSTTWTTPLGDLQNVTILYDEMFANGTLSSIDDIRIDLDIKIRPEGGYVKIHNVTYFANDFASNLSLYGNMSVMYKVTAPSQEHLRITGEIWIQANHTYAGATYIANYTLVYANLTKSIGGSYEWIVVGKDAATIDCLGAAYMTEAFDSIKEIQVKMAGMDINETAYGPYAPFVMGGAVTGTKADYRDTLGRPHLRDDWCRTTPVSSSNMLFSGGPLANLGTEYFNEFTNAFWTRTEYVVNDTGHAYKIFALSCWNRTSYSIGYAVVSVYKDINGTIGFLIWGRDGQDTYYAAKWFWDSGITYLQTENRGVTDIILKITYPTADPTHPTVSKVERLGTISEKTPHDC